MLFQKVYGVEDARHDPGPASISSIDLPELDTGSFLLLDSNTVLFQYDFWKEPVSIGDSADIMVKGALLDGLKLQLGRHNVTYQTIIDDVQE